MPQLSLAQFAVDVARLSVWLLILAAIFVPLERLFAVRPSRVFRRETAVDLAWYFITNLAIAPLLILPVSVLAWCVHAVIPAGFHAHVAALPVWAKFAAALVVGEIGFYWGHRLAHEMPFLWRFHAIHHSAEHMDFLVNSRAHPIDTLFERLCGLIPMYVLGLGTTVPIAVLLIRPIWGFFVHSNLRWRLGPLEWIVATPFFHHWHHTTGEHIDRNYAATLPFIDRLFGTHYRPRDWPERYGIDTPMPASLHGQLLHPFRAGPAPRTERAPEPLLSGTPSA